MVANAVKTVEYAFATSGSNIATNTTLGTSTRYDFTLIGVNIPETTSRTFKSVILEIYYRDAFTTVYNTSGWRIGITCGSNAASDVDYTPTAQGNTGDHETTALIRDVTDYFNDNFGTSASQSCQASFVVSTATAANVGNITAKLYITYEYEASGSRSIKTVRIPIQSASAALTAAAIEIGTGGTSAAPANQIPALDTFLPETNKTYISTWFETFCNDGGAATTDFNAVYQINTGATVSRTTLEQALNTGTFYHDIWLIKYNNGSGIITDTYTISASAASAFKAYSSLTTRFDDFGGIYTVTYEYDSTSASVMNSILLPLDSAPGFIASTTGSNANYISKDIWVVEPNVTLAQSGILIYVQSPAASTLNIAAGSQTARPYGLTSLANSGGHALIHRIDHNSGFSLERGKNTANLTVYTSSAATANSLVGFIILNYTSSSASGGETCHNHTTIWFNKSQIASGTVATHNIITTDLQRTPIIYPTNYFLNGLAHRIGSRFGAAAEGVTLVTEKLSGEFNGNGWNFLDTWVHQNDGELSIYTQIAATLDSFNQDINHRGKLNIESNREYRLYFSTAANYWLMTYVTYHCNTFTISGSFVNPTGSGSNVIVDIYRVNDNYWSGSVLSTSSGSYSALVFDNVYPYFASASQDATHIGRSASAVAV